MKLSLPSHLTRRGKSVKPRDKPLKHKCMMITIITVPPTCHHQQEAEDEAVGEDILIRLIIMDMKTITITMDIITTTTGAATMTRTMAMRTSKHPGEEEEQEEESVVVPIRPGAVVLSLQGVEWASPNEEASEQSEQGNGAEGGPDLSQWILT